MRRNAPGAGRQAEPAGDVVPAVLHRRFRLQQAPRSAGPRVWNQYGAEQEQLEATSLTSCVHESSGRATALFLCHRPNRTAPKKGNPQDHMLPRNSESNEGSRPPPHASKRGRCKKNAPRRPRPPRRKQRPGPDLRDAVRADNFGAFAESPFRVSRPSWRCAQATRQIVLEESPSGPPETGRRTTSGERSGPRKDGRDPPMKSHGRDLARLRSLTKREGRIKLK